MTSMTNTRVEKRLGIIILNYNNLQDTIKCIDSIWNMVGSTTASIIVVDNNSENNEADILESSVGNKITVLRSDRNYGYAKGNNLGIEYAIGQGLEYLCILNNDTVLRDNFFPDLIEYLDIHSDVAFVSPAIVLDNMIVQSTGGTINFFKGNSYYYNAEIPYEQVQKGEIDCDILSGACIIFKSNIIKTIGYIPEAYFLFFEETEWCYKAKNHGLRCVSLTSHYVVHKSSVSIRKTDGLQEYLMERNKVVFCKRNSSFPIFLCFLIFDTARTIWQGLFEKIPAVKRFKYHLDGLFGLVDKRFPFIWINSKC